MGSYFSEVEAAHLRKGTLALATGYAPKVLAVLGGIGDFIKRAIGGHEPQAEAKGAFGLLAGHGTANLFQQVAHDRGADLPTAIDQGRPRRQSQRRVRPEPAQPSHQVGEHLGHIEPAKQGKGDHIIDHDEVVEAAFALFPGVAPGQQLTDLFARTQSFEHFKA
jgi:hypothetical protein